VIFTLMFALCKSGERATTYALLVTSTGVALPLARGLREKPARGLRFALHIPPGFELHVERKDMAGCEIGFGPIGVVQRHAAPREVREILSLRHVVSARQAIETMTFGEAHLLQLPTSEQPNGQARLLCIALRTRSAEAVISHAWDSATFG